MFNLDNAITEWRRRMAAGGVKNSAVLDELESHLREDIERQTKPAMTPEDAFNLAVQKIGPASVLSKEFRKTAVGSALEKLMIAIAVLFLAFGVFLSAAAIILCYGSLAERLMGLVAMSSTILTACVWTRVIPHLPMIAQKRKRISVEVACFFSGYVIAMLYVQFIVPHFEHSPDRMIPAVGFWALFPIAVGLSVACGIERAAKKSVCKFA